MIPKLGLRETRTLAANEADYGICSEYVKEKWRNLIRNIDGATAIEYGLLAGLVAVGLAGGLGALADLVNLLFDSISDETTDVAATVTAP